MLKVLFLINSCKYICLTSNLITIMSFVRNLRKFKVTSSIWSPYIIVLIGWTSSIFIPQAVSKATSSDMGLRNLLEDPGKNPPQNWCPEYRSWFKKMNVTFRICVPYLLGYMTISILSFNGSNIFKICVINLWNESYFVSVLLPDLDIHKMRVQRYPTTTPTTTGNWPLLQAAASQHRTHRKRDSGPKG